MSPRIRQFFAEGGAGWFITAFLLAWTLPIAIVLAAILEAQP